MRAKNSERPIKNPSGMPATFYQDGPNDMGIGWNVLASLQRVAVGFGLAALAGIPPADAHVIRPVLIERIGKQGQRRVQRAQRRGKAFAATPLSTLDSALTLFADPFYQDGPNDMGIGWNVLASLQSAD
jgi:hypothetical protein